MIFLPPSGDNWKCLRTFGYAKGTAADNFLPLKKNRSSTVAITLLLTSHSCLIVDDRSCNLLDGVCISKIGLRFSPCGIMFDSAVFSFCNLFLALLSVYIKHPCYHDT